MDFEILGEITALETIAFGRGIRDLRGLQRNYGKGRWRKMKGSARIRLRNGDVRLAELHWYSARLVSRTASKLRVGESFAVKGASNSGLLVSPFSRSTQGYMVEPAGIEPASVNHPQSGLHA